MNTYSFTQLKTFEMCPRRWYLRYRLRLKELETEALQFGSLFHQCIAHMIMRHDPDIPRVVQIYREKYKLINDQDLNQVAQALHNVSQSFRLDRYSSYQVESLAYLKLDENNQLVGIRDFMGFQNQIYDRIEVIDWKTGWKTDPSEYLRQLDLYAAMTQAEYPDVPIEVILWWVRYKNGKDSSVPEPEAGVEWARNIIKQIDEAQNEPEIIAYPPKPGKGCPDCGLAIYCIGEGIPDELADDETARDVAGMALRIEAAATQLKGLLKRYLEPGKALEIGGEWWGNYAYTQFKFRNISAVIDLLEQHGLDPTEYLTVDSNKLKQVRQRNLELWEAITALAEAQPRAYFTHRSTPPIMQQDENNPVSG